MMLVATMDTEGRELFRPERNAMISIVIPVYNAEAFLAKMLESILQQSYCDYEIVLVNDGSKDNSSAVCHSFAEKYSCIKVFDRENGGASAARNFGAQQATGEFVWFMDSDDQLAKDALQTAVDLQKKYDADVVIGGMNFCFTEEGITKPKALEQELLIPAQEFAQHYSVLFGKNYISSLCNKLIRRSVISDNDLQMIPQLHMYEDYIYCMDLLLKCQTVICTPVIFYQYLLREGHSLSRRYRPDTLGMFCILHERITLYKQTLNNIAAERSLDRQIIYLAYECVKNEARCKQAPLKNIRMLINHPNFKSAMRLSCTGAMQYRIAHFLMKHRCAFALWLYLKLAGKDK